MSDFFYSSDNLGTLNNKIIPAKKKTNKKNIAYRIDLYSDTIAKISIPITIPIFSATS